jgi:hypothetical protein
VKAIKGKVNGFAALDGLPAFRSTASKAVKPLCGLTAQSKERRSRRGMKDEKSDDMPALLCENRLRFFGCSLKIIARFPAVQTRAIRYDDSTSFASSGGQA